jgi:trk system potassium uptake protein TrkA
MGERVARSLLSSKIKEQIALFSEGHSIMEIEAPSTFIGKTLRELDIRAKFKVNVIAIKRQVTKVNAQGEFSKVEKVDITPNPDDVISKGDILLVFGDNEGINRLRRQ